MDGTRVGILVERFDLTGVDIELDAESLWPALTRGGFSRSDAVVAQVDELLPLGTSLLRPRAIGRLYDVGPAAEPEQETLPEPIREAESLCFGLCTAGAAIDDRARALCEEGELIDSMILDAIAMTGLSLICDQLGRTIFDWAEQRGLSASRTFSPGAGASGWKLENQRFVFAHLPDDPLGVRLTPHFLMQPSKSVSFVIGIGERIKQATNPFSCEGCDRFDCAYRHIPGDEMVGEGAA
jgi:hypothetical protein